MQNCLVARFSEYSAIDIQQISPKDQRNKTKVNNADYFSKEIIGKIRFNNKPNTDFITNMANFINSF